MYEITKANFVVRLARKVAIRFARREDSDAIETLILKWLKFKVPREESLKRAMENNELLVAECEGRIIGFIHSVMHEDIIDGGLNSFITAFYVEPEHRQRGVGSKLLRKAIDVAIEKGAVEIETSTHIAEAKAIYEHFSFKQYKKKEVFLELDVKDYLQRKADFSERESADITCG